MCLQLPKMYKKQLIYLRLNETKCNERDDKWFPEFLSEMIECESVIVNMCEVCKCKDASIQDASETKRVTVVLGGLSFLGFCIKECDVNKWAKLCVCQTRTATLCVSSSAQGIRECMFTCLTLMLANGLVLMCLLC